MITAVKMARWVRRRGGRHNGPVVSTAMVAVVLLATAVAILGFPVRACQIEAATPHALTDFCYSMRVNVKNETGATITDYPVALTVNASLLKTNGNINAHAWDVRAVDGSLGVVHLMTQNLTSNAATWWIQVPSIAAGETQVYTLYLGAANAHRDNAIIYGGASDITATHNAAFNVTATLQVNVFAETDATHASAGWLLSHFNTAGSTGYRLGVIDVSGQRKIRAQVDNQTLDVDWDGNLAEITMTFQNPTLEILFDGVSQGTLSTGLGAISTNSDSLIAGSGFTGSIRVAEVIDNIDTTPTRVVRWGAHGEDVSEVTAVDPTWTGTVPDDTGNGHTGTYTITAAQSGTVTVSVGNVFNNFADPLLVLSDRIGANILGDAFSSATDLITPANTGAGIPGGGWLNSFATDIGVPSGALWYFTVSILAIVAMVFVATVAQTSTGALAVPTAVFLVFGIVGPIALWVPVVLGLATVGVYGLGQIGKAGA